MTDKLKIGFVSAWDASDITARSGVPYHMLMHLKKQNVQVEVFSPLNNAFKCLLALRSYASQIERLMRKRPVDVILSTNSIPVSLLNCRQPVLIWADAVFHQMH